MPHTYGTKEWETSFCQLGEDLLFVENPPYIMGTPSWVLAYEKEIQGDEIYAAVAKGWHGSVVEHVLADPEVGLDEDIYLHMDLENGQCRSVRLVPHEVGENADYVLTAEYVRWRQIIKGELDPIKAIMQGKIKLKGHLPTLVRYAKAAARLAYLVGQVPIIFLDDMSPDEIEAFKPWIEFLRDEYSL
jgi:putative sterol carrier protein